MGREMADQNNYSEAVAEKIDKEIEAILRGAEKRATEIVTRRKDMLQKIAKILVEKETIEREEYEKIIGAKSQITNSKSQINSKTKR